MTAAAAVGTRVARAIVGQTCLEAKQVCRISIGYYTRIYRLYLDKSYHMFEEGLKDLFI